MSAAPKLAQFQMLPLDKIVECALNPRRSFDRAKHEELTESVRAKGVLEPILVRPLGPSREAWEVAAGARRVRAAKEAGLVQIPAMVRDMSDTELLEVALLENVVRHDLSALDEGDAYRALVKEHGYTVEQLVEKTGKSRTAIFARLKLAELQGEPRDLVNSGQWSASIGELIARLPTEKAQLAAMKRLKEKQEFHVDGVAGITFRRAKEILETEFKLELKDATFDLFATDLVPDVGACSACPKRTHHADNREAFADVREDTCLDDACWNKKKAASFKLLQAELAAAGKKLVKEKTLFENSYYGREKQQLARAAAEKYSKPSDEVLGEKTWKDLLGAEVPKVVVLDADNKTHNLVDRKAAIALLEEKNPKVAAKLKEAAATPPKEDWEAKRQAEQKRHEAKRAAARVVRTKALSSVTKLEVAVELLLLGYSRTWEWNETLRAAGLPKSAKPAQLKPAQRVQFVLGRALTSNTSEDAVEAAAKLTKLDLKAMTKKALEATPGTCFACSKAAPEKQTLCADCGGEGEE
jgi:ParB/RepB/Spo0J family partition protein